MQTILQILVGVVACATFIAVARRAGVKGELRLYAAGLFIAALIYAGFVARDATPRWLVTELAGLVVFTLVALAGLKISGWILAAGWAAHALWDLLLHKLVYAAFVPDWYPLVCLAFDLLLAIYIAVRIKKGAFT
ncbi:MAG TPA: DUF6010 family protein [Pyrinomonadaceae bacterium]|nr:DUF6010 family protein [Pyrinomonadaceae bacterium]